jgi:hypothetical protein
LGKVFLGPHCEQVPNAHLNHLVVLIGLVLCVCSGHEPLTLGPKFIYFNGSVGFGDVDHDEGTVVGDVEQRNLLQESRTSQIN